MGIIGIEMSDVIYGIIEKMNLDFVIVIDVLVVCFIEWVNSMI